MNDLYTILTAVERGELSPKVAAERLRERAPVAIGFVARRVFAANAVRPKPLGFMCEGRIVSAAWPLKLTYSTSPFALVTQTKSGAASPMADSSSALVRSSSKPCRRGSAPSPPRFVPGGSHDP